MPEATTQIPAQAALPAATAISANLLARIEAALSRFEAKAKADEASVKTWLGKYWPIAAGLAVAATRFL